MTLLLQEYSKLLHQRNDTLTGKLTPKSTWKRHQWFKNSEPFQRPDLNDFDWATYPQKSPKKCPKSTQKYCENGSGGPRIVSYSGLEWQGRDLDCAAAGKVSPALRWKQGTGRGDRHRPRLLTESESVGAKAAKGGGYDLDAQSLTLQKLVKRQ